MRIFITGAGSFIGRELIRLARSRSIACFGIDTAAIGIEGCTVADIRSTTLASLIPDETDAIVHLAALSRDPDCRGNIQSTIDINVSGALNVMAAGVARDARQFIFASTEWIYTNFTPNTEKTETDVIDASLLTSEYALSKYMAENALRLASFSGSCPATILRFGIVYGPRRENWSALESIVSSVGTQDKVSVGSLRTGRHFIHVSDVAAAIIASIGRPNFDVFNIQGSRLISLGDIIAETSTQLSRSPQIVERDPLNPSIRRVSGDRAASQLPWRAEIGLPEGIASLIDYFGFHRVR